MINSLRPFIILLLLISSGLVQAIEFVALHSNVSSIPVGSVLNDDSAFQLYEGDSVTLVSDSGTIYTVGGPIEGWPPRDISSHNPGIAQKLADVLAGMQNQGSLAVGRRAAYIHESWAIKLNTNGPFCISDYSLAGIARSDVDYADSWTMLDIDSGNEVKLEWEEGQFRIAWPLEVQINQSQWFRFYHDTKPEMEVFIIHLPEIHPDSIQIVTDLADAGCMEQARLKLQSLM